MQYQWQFNGVDIPGATNATLTLTNVQATDEGSYRVLIRNIAGSVTSDAATFILVRPPQIISTSPTAPGTYWIATDTTLSVVASGADPADFPLSYQWQLNGTNIPDAAASNYTISVHDVYGHLSYDVMQEGSYSVVVSNAAGSTTVTAWDLRLAAPGMVVAWGDDYDGECERPRTLTNTLAVAAGLYHSVAVAEDGSVVTWGANWGNVPGDLTNAVAVAAGFAHTLALRSDGTVSAWGDNTFQQTNVPSTLTNAVAISAGPYQNLALTRNGTVVSWGTGPEPAPPPPGLTNLSAIAMGGDFGLGLSKDSTVTAWGESAYGETNIPPGLSNVVAIAAGVFHALALRENGTIVAWGNNTAGQTDVPAGLTNVMAIAAGFWYSVALKNDGTVVAWGDNTFGQTNVPVMPANVKAIAAGGAHILAAMFSPTVQYPVDVTKDLLLIYNTNSADSKFVKDYYLAHRPMVASANVLGIGCVTNETALHEEFTNQIAAPILQWLTDNPTKRPQYVILFLDVPSRCSTNRNYSAFGDHPSVSVSLVDIYPGLKPFISHLNMGDSDACKAYIDKLESIGANYSPGKLIISASSGGYGNTNYILDGIRYGGPPPLEDYSPNWSVVASATNSLLAAGVSVSAISFSDGLEILTNNVVQPLSHPSGHVNVAGYICWGAHSSLGAAYATNSQVQWTGNSSWWIIETAESFNGWRSCPYQGTFIKWFSANAFGTTNFSNTPVGAVSHVDEPGAPSNASDYFGLWARGKNFAIAAWNSKST